MMMMMLELARKYAGVLRYVGLVYHKSTGRIITTDDLRPKG